MTSNDPKKGTVSPFRYAAPNLLQIALPMGGIGAGCVCLNGYGGIQDFSIRNQPSTTAMPDAHYFTDSAFALLHIAGEKPITRLVEGPIPVEKVYDQGLQNQGYRKGGHEGMPRFKNATFEGSYPLGTVHLFDPALPVQVKIVGWSPFIPGDDRNSGTPVAILDYTLENTSDAPVTLEFSFHAAHLAVGSKGETGTRNQVLTVDGEKRGVLFTNTEDAEHPTAGSAAIAIASGSPAVKAMWFRGGWFDSLYVLWREIEQGKFIENDGSVSQKGHGGRNGGSVLVRCTLEPGETTTIPVIFSWYFPNNPQTVGVVGGEEIKRNWHPFYTTLWKDAGDVAASVIANLGTLRQRTVAFRDALFASTLPSPVLDAVASNLSIMKSPTVLRQANGNLWGWEGCFSTGGCCHGTCTHVWNYAQAFPHLFPSLERTLREQEYLRSMDGRGHVNFRAALPDAPTSHDFHAAADGQLGGLLKLYRDWQISGDTEWLRRLYPLAKRSLDYCIAIWDPNQQGALFEPHHNTYDIEFWGPDGMCSSIYLGALSAMAEIARALGKEEDATTYADIAARGATFLDTELFNGEYYEQRVQWEGLRDTSFAELVAKIAADPEADEMSRLLQQEGPKYQYGKGCLADGVIGAWMATLYGVETPLSRENVRQHLQSLHRYNFKPDLSEHACLQRPGYAIGSEAGLLLCTWPHGEKPTLPFVYSDEVWTGFEYQVASHMLLEGFVKEGIDIVTGARARYNGHARNPYNEYECGNYYARAMSSYALLLAYSGFRYSKVSNTLWFGSQVTEPGCQAFFAVDGGFGVVKQTADTLEIQMVEGMLTVETVHLTHKGQVSTFTWGATATVDAPAILTLAR